MRKSNDRQDDYGGKRCVREELCGGEWMGIRRGNRQGNENQEKCGGETAKALKIKRNVAMKLLGQWK